jgi:hypothetical protein
LGFLGWIDRLFYSCYTKYEKSKFLSLDQILDYKDLKEDLEKIVLDEKRSKESNSLIEKWIEDSKIEKFDKKL